MEWKDQQEYEADTEFTQAQLLEITPRHIVRFMCLKAYGTEDPAHDANPIHRRASGLEFVKKAVSFFMPNRNAHWNVETATGNPTMSVAVNDLIKRIKRQEVRKRGKKSNAKRDLKRPEFRKTLRLLESHTNCFNRRFRSPSMAKLQFHIIARADDISHLETNDLREHDKFKTFAAQVKVSWSKNVLEDRDCPDQILLGANDPDFCVLLGLGCYLETRFTNRQQPNAAGSRYLFGQADEEDEPLRVNDRYRDTLKKIWEHPEMVELTNQVRGSIGSHSLRKFASTWPAEHGISQDDIEIRGRWKGGRNGRTVNRYINVEQLPTDGKVAGVLAVGGPVKYKAKTGSNVTFQFLRDVVAPGIYEHFSVDETNRITSILALPLLWAAHQPGLEHMMSNIVRNRIREGYAMIRGENPADYNPVTKSPLLVTRVENNLCIDEMMILNPDAAPDQPADPEQQQLQLQQAQQLVGTREQLQHILNQVHHLRQQQQETQQTFRECISELRQWMVSKFNAQKEMINRLRQAAPFAPPPPVVNGGGAAGPQAGGIPAGPGAAEEAENLEGPPRRNATLSRGPKTIHDLWQEYQHGIGGRIAAKNFRPTERGRCKFTYSKRNVIWQIIKDLVLAGIDSDVACDRFYQAYGHNKSVTYITDRVYADKAGREGEAGKHPLLRVGA